VTAVPKRNGVNSSILHQHKATMRRSVAVDAHPPSAGYPATAPPIDTAATAPRMAPAAKKAKTAAPPKEMPVPSVASRVPEPIYIDTTHRTTRSAEPLFSPVVRDTSAIYPIYRYMTPITFAGGNGGEEGEGKGGDNTIDEELEEVD